MSCLSFSHFAWKTHRVHESVHVLAMSMQTQRPLRSVAVLLVGVVLLLNSTLDFSTGRSLSAHHESKVIVNPYSQVEIEITAPHLEQFQTRLLVFDGNNFAIYNLNYKDNHDLLDKYCEKCAENVPLLVRALKDLNPERFKPGQPVFQLMFSDADYYASKCVNHGECPGMKDFAPLLLFGSTPRNIDDAPTVKGFPHTYYIRCLHHYIMYGIDQCQWREQVKDDIEWDSLINTIIWRGGNYPFVDKYEHVGAKENVVQKIDFGNATTTNDVLNQIRHHWDELTPRWKAALLTLEADRNHDPWIDVKFSEGSWLASELEQFCTELGFHVVGESLWAEEMSQYKYQIDLGGWGGTTWKGTITKLAMPGLLFHHVTPSRDFFYDEMKPWIHYVPIDCDLGNLHDKYEWAEANKDESKRIAESGQQLFQKLMSREYIARLYEELFVNYLGQVLDAYIPSDESWSSMQDRYKQNGFNVFRVGICDEVDCEVDLQNGEKRRFRYASLVSNSPSVITSTK